MFFLARGRAFPLQHIGLSGNRSVSGVGHPNRLTVHFANGFCKKHTSM